MKENNAGRQREKLVNEKEEKQADSGSGRETDEGAFKNRNK